MFLFLVLLSVLGDFNKNALDSKEFCNVANIFHWLFDS